MARSDPRSNATERRTGVVPRGLSKPRTSNPQRDRIAALSVAFLAVVVLVVLVAMFNGTAISVQPTASPTAGGVAVGYTAGPPSIGPSLPPFTQEPTTAPTPTFAPTPRVSFSPSPSPTPSPTPTPTPTPSPTPTPTPSPTPTSPPTEPPVTPPPAVTPEPTVPTSGLIILDPLNGRATTERVVVVRGIAAPGSVVTRDVPMWFDEHAIADSAGRWSFALALNIGDNSFLFRVGDDRTTEVTLTIHCFAN